MQVEADIAEYEAHTFICIFHMKIDKEREKREKKII